MPARARSIARRLGLALVVLAAIGAAAAYQYYRTRPRALVLSGTIEGPSVTVGSLVGGRVKEVLVEEGSQVTAGQVMARLETDALDLQLAEQRAAIDAARAQLEKARRGPRSQEIERARVLRDSFERERRRFETLLGDDIVSREEYDQKASAVRVAEEELDLLQKGTRPEEIEAARAALEQAERRLATLEEQRQESEIVASVAGTVQTFDLRPGDMVAGGEGVAELIEPSRIWVRVYVPETWIGKVTLGAPVKIRVDSFPDTIYDGTVSQIATEAEYTPRNIQTRAQRAEQVFGVKVTFAPHPHLKPGMAAEVDLGIRGRVD